jgi:hypothetical protein
MIVRSFSSIFDAYIGLTDELAYGEPPAGLERLDPLKWGVCLGFPDLLTVKIDDALKNDGLSLGDASYTKSRWTRFLRRYFRDDLPGWIEESLTKLKKYPSRPFVASYSVNLNTGHNYGGCLASLQLRINPKPEVIMYSRACHIDKVGFLDLALINAIAIRTGLPRVSAQWIISNGYISAISQIFYLKRFQKPTEGHRLERSMGRLTSVDYDAIKFGPLKRGRKRMMALDEFGEIPRSIKVCDLSIEPSKFLIQEEKPIYLADTPEAMEDFFQEHGLT